MLLKKINSRINKREALSEVTIAIEVRRETQRAVDSINRVANLAA
jgi:hypothetical protein